MKNYIFLSVCTLFCFGMEKQSKLNITQEHQIDILRMGQETALNYFLAEQEVLHVLQRDHDVFQEREMFVSLIRNYTEKYEGSRTMLKTKTMQRIQRILSEETHWLYFTICVKTVSSTLEKATTPFSEKIVHLMNSVLQLRKLYNMVKDYLSAHTYGGNKHTLNMLQQQDKLSLFIINTLQSTKKHIKDLANFCHFGQLLYEVTILANSLENQELRNKLYTFLDKSIKEKKTRIISPANTTTVALPPIEQLIQTLE